jgi:hypothetical protein
MSYSIPLPATNKVKLATGWSLSYAAGVKPHWPGSLASTDIMGMYRAPLASAFCWESLHGRGCGAEGDVNEGRRRLHQRGSSAT